jgi:UDP-N-acetylmuramate dehydrogenase
MQKPDPRFKTLGRALRGKLLIDEPLSRHTSFRIGGPADFYCYPKDLEDLASLVATCKAEGIPRFVIGNGTNLLAADAGFRGAVLDLSEAFREIRVTGKTATADAGVTLWDLLKTLGSRGLAGLESLAGIPGQVGGALRLNAGAYGAEIGDCLASVAVLDGGGEMALFERKALRMEYRQTDFPEDSVIVQARFELREGDASAIEASHQAALAKRREKQPLSLPSAGSVFKRPPGDFAGRLIEEAGLKGLRIGDAMVSKKHANFIVNCQSASASDVRRLIEEVQNRVRERFGTDLEPEIHFLGFGDAGR